MSSEKRTIFFKDQGHRLVHLVRNNYAPINVKTQGRGGGYLWEIDLASFSLGRDFDI